jgi:hypothetical protein
MLSGATQIPDKTSKSFIVGSCVAGPIRYKLPFACFIPGVARRGAADRGEHRQGAGAFAEAVIRSVELIVQGRMYKTVLSSMVPFVIVAEFVKTDN